MQFSKSSTWAKSYECEVLKTLYLLKGQSSIQIILVLLSFF